MKNEIEKNSEQAETISAAAVELRRAYYREWRKKNPEKIKANNQRYWEKKAAKMAQQQETDK